MVEYIFALLTILSLRKRAVNSVYLGLSSVVNGIILHSTVATIYAIFLLADLGLFTF